MKLSVPGKTFLVGEYLALSGGPSLLLATAPRFEMLFQEGAGEREPRLPFAGGSPAAKFFHSSERTGGKTIKIQFADPHQGRGGLGASSAQFALLYAALNGAPKAWSWSEMLEKYQACAWNGEGRAPSGADVVAQMTGGVTWFDGRSSEVEKLSWSFPNLAFTLVRTGRKLATHEHLRKAISPREEALRPLVEDAKNALVNKDESELARAVDSYARELEAQGLQSEATLELIREIRGADQTYGFDLTAAKGCGAMGADVILLLHTQDARERLQRWLQEERLVICGDEQKLSEGLKIDERH